MLTKKKIYLKAKKELEKRRLNRTIKKEKNEKIAFEKCKEIEILCRQIRRYSCNMLMSIFSKKHNISEVCKKIQKQNIWAQNKIEKLLIENNLPADFLNPPPVCKICEDYGYIENEYCSCFRKLVKSIASKELMDHSNLPKLTFKNFNLNFYLNSYFYTKNGEMKRTFDHMSLVFEECKKFAENFNPNCGGLLMCGKTGLGKTHLSLAIAFEIIEKGYTAFCETASQMVRNMMNYKFNFKENEDDISYISLISETDLLILDDLGCESHSTLNKSSIFEIINIRTSLNKPIIVNTNYEPKELEKEYGEKTVSRLFSTLNVLAFKGDDNREKII